MFLMLWLLYTLLYTEVEAKLSCIGDDGQPVDMFILYKLPRLQKYATPDVVHSGHGYAYLDSRSPSFRLSQHSIADDTSAAGATLDQVYSKFPMNENDYHKDVNGRYRNGPEDIAHVFYNDENPDGSPYYPYCGHTKGALAFDSEAGFWLITSVPRYPSAAAGRYAYPHTGCRYGQMFMCVTFNTSTFDSIGEQLRFNDPHIHDGNLPQSWEESFPNIHKALSGEMIKDKESRVAPLRSLAGIEYTSFAKSKKFAKDLYRDLVAPQLAQDIFVETWRHDKAMNSSCDVTYRVEDILKLSIPLPVQDFPFANYDDHSKFAVGVNDAHVCVGDINRAESQWKRGGGTLCLKDVSIWKQFKSFITVYMHCPSN